MEAARDEEYYQKYSAIAELLRQAYIDMYCLDTIKDIVTNCKHARFPSSVVFVSNHLSYLLKEDLCLILWKVYYDTDKRSNGIKRLNSYVSQKYQKRVRISDEPAQMRKIESVLDKANILRNQHIAHEDNEKTHVEIGFDEMCDTLEWMRKSLNQLCFPDIDNRVKPIEQTEVYNLSGAAKIGFGLMLFKNDVSENNTEEK